ncbi:hypothetical protein EON82_17435 [bacterium]|nr:MAG: hypothetical protein EON82_17435 [bacterium]
MPTVRFFTAGGDSPLPHSIVSLPVVPREGESYVSLRSGYPSFYSVLRVVHVEGNDPIVMLLVDEDRSVEDIVISMTHPAEDAWA